MWPEAIVSWILAAAFVGFVAGRVNRSQVTWTALSLVLSPTVGLIALLVVGDGEPEDASANRDADDQNQRRCTAQEGQVFPSDRAECPHCGSVIDAGDSLHPRVQ
jgi:hypothetical protein